MGFVEAALQKEHVIVDVEIERSAKALNERDRAGLKLGAKSLLFGLFSDVRRDRTMDDGEYFSLDLGVLGQDESHRHGETQDPLADSGLGKYLVDEMGG